MPYLHHHGGPSDVLSWITHLREYEKIKGTTQPHERIFSMLRLQFNDLDNVTKLMFIDICLYASKALRQPMLSNSPRQDMINWLANIHEVPTAVVESKNVEVLKRSAMINMEGDKIVVHDLYKEFATWYLGQLTRADEFLGVWCVGNRGDLDNFLPYELRRTPQRCWPELKRIQLENILCGGLPVRKLQEWCNVVVLQIVGCTNLTTMNLQGFTCLRHLDLWGLQSLKTLAFTEDASSSFSNMPQGTYTDQDLLPPLQFVIIDGLSSLECLPPFTAFTSLKFLKAVRCDCLIQPPSVQHCSGLERMWLEWHPNHKALPSLTGLTSLRDLIIINKDKQFYQGEALRLEGLSSLSSLGALKLRIIPVADLPGLENLTRLECLELTNMHYLRCLPPLENLAKDYALHMLIITPRFDNTQQIQNLNELMKRKLERLFHKGEKIPHTHSKIKEHLHFEHRDIRRSLGFAYRGVKMPLFLRNL